MSETPIPDDPGREEEIPIDPRVTPAMFREWRAPRFGTANPERMNNPVWEWLVRSELSAYHHNERLDGPKAMDAGPGWCFMRYCQKCHAARRMAGRCALRGEHEDHYDPDFQIYNDVVVLHPDGRVDIFGYPPEVFPATDFHTATLIENRIVIVGNLKAIPKTAGLERPRSSHSIST